MHRLSGLLLALFLPLHFWALGQALHGAAAFDGFLRLADQRAVPLAEWGLVVLLSLHMMGGVRLLAHRVRPMRRACARTGSPAPFAASVATGMAFALALVS